MLEEVVFDRCSAPKNVFQWGFRTLEATYQEVDLMLLDRTDPVQIGVRAFLPADGFRVGKNILTVQKRYFDEDVKAKTYAIPFWYSPE